MVGSKPGKPPTLAELREAVAAIIGGEPGAIPEDANLVHLGVDSLGMMRLTNRLRRGGLRASFQELAAEPTLAAWQRYMEALRRDPTGDQTGGRDLDDGAPRR